VTLLLAQVAYADDARLDDARWWFLGLGAASAATIVWQEALAPEQPQRTQEGFTWLYGEPATPKALNEDAATWARASDVLMLGAIGADLAYAGTFSDVDLTLHLEALMAGFVTIQTLKLTVRAPRPTTWISADELATLAERDPERAAELAQDRASTDAWMSFPSGHAGLAATASAALATQLWLEERPGWAAAATAGGAAVTVGTGLARVEAGKHHPVDVVVGGLLGAGAGVGVPLLGHRTGPQIVALPGGAAVAGRW